MTDKRYRFATIEIQGEGFRVSVYDVVRPLCCDNVEKGEVDRFLATMNVDEIMTDERGGE